MIIESEKYTYGSYGREGMESDRTLCVAVADRESATTVL